MTKPQPDDERDETPLDVHDQVLVGAVAPPAWENRAPTGRYDLVVIGGGPAGLVTALGAAAMGKKVALIERHRLGGDCLNTGCVPSKALIRSGRALADVRDAAAFGVLLEGEPTVDFPAVMERMRRLRAGLGRHDAAARFREAGIDVFFGEARFVDRDAVEVAGTRLSFIRAGITTGARAALPKIPGLAAGDRPGEAAVLTSETVFSLRSLPARLAVIGAGTLGCELASAFARFGSKVTLIESAHGVLPREDSDAAARVRASLERDGVAVHCCSRETTVEQEAGRTLLRLHSHEESPSLEVDAILVATGRRPNLEGLGLGAAGVAATEEGVVVDDFLRTTNKRIFAAGDVCSRHQFTHAADAMARIVIRNGLLPWLPGKSRVSKLVIPRTTYTDPEVAQVGLTERELRSQGRSFETVEVDLASNDRAVLDGESGFLKVQVGSGGKILGATLVSRHAGESLGELTAAMVHGLPLQALSSVIHAYPTQAEAIKRAADSYRTRRLLRLRDWLLHPWKTLRTVRARKRLSLSMTPNGPSKAPASGS